MFTPLESLVLATVAYTAQFDYPLSREEIYQRFLSFAALKTIGVKLAKSSKTPEKKLSLVRLNKVVNNLIKKNLLIANDPNSISQSLLTSRQESWLSLAGQNKTSNLVSYRNKRQKLAKKRLPEWQMLQKMLASVPWVLAAAMTGSAAMANGAQKSDLDVMVIAMPGRLWLARIWVVFLTWFYKKRHASGWCFNLWLEPAELGLSPQRQGVYEAYELWQCYWLVDKANWRYAWLDRNSWFKNFLPLASLTPKFYRKVITSTEDSEIFPDWFAKLANSLAYYIQIHYRRWRHGEALASRSQAFLHASDSRARIYARWQNQLAGLGLIQKYDKT